MALSTSSRVYIVAGSGIILLALVAFVVYPLIVSNQDEDELPVVVVPNRTALTPLPATSGDPTVSDTTIIANELGQSELVEKSEIERVARLFVERFGSYSNYSDFSNITSLFSVMTPSMRNVAQGIIEAGVDQNDYNSVITKLITYNLASFTSKQSAAVQVIVQEDRQAEANGLIQTNQKTGTIQLRYEQGAWKVHSLLYQ
jgi:hypothetical protein